MEPVDARHGQGKRRTFNILLIAYEFPPSPSPQSLRWAYLAAGLAAHGHRIHVLAPEHPGSNEGLPGLPCGVVVHRTFAGPGMGLLNLLARKRRSPQRRSGMEASTGKAASVPRPDTPGADVAVPEPLNWKGRVHNALSGLRTWLFHGVHRLIGIGFFPDGRSEWYPWARKGLDRLLAAQGIDLVVSSHEPATTLSLGLRASRKGYPWIADLGDPVLAPYTPGRWRRRALRLEREVCASADLVCVTTDATARVLSERHGMGRDRLVVLTQGFEGRNGHAADPPVFTGERTMELLYTGSLYAFRKIGPLIEAVERTPGVRLNIASVSVPEDVLAASRRSASIRLLGFLPHAEAVEWQGRCDVLVNLANDNPCQVPGKFYEYLGACRPILHIGDGDDAAAELLQGIPRGWVCGQDPDQLARTLLGLLADARTGRFAGGLDLSAGAVGDYDWTVISSRLNDRMTTLIAEHGK
ncbi:glycosyltransferase [Luteimonas terricola]|uniref:Glycosyltransferase subfamily 4-like N-terminal domain-containing protein n=1 Tax=Luteimonas terricola TaxID=645597 RepID=A0ABQ2EL73_9GAMM|nr:glycosyltransferase [Luteimonas terricola]GGK13421.1 hypothetical protein GCM10011394_23340 [Luteimonas terricola]